MKNNKGFTVVEMGVSFCLIFVICILLFQIILSLKEVYIDGEVATDLLTKQAIILNKIYKDLEENNVISVTNTNNDFTITFADDTSKILSVDSENKKITYDDYVWKLDDDNIIGTVSLETKTINSINYFKIDIPISNSLTPEKEYGISIIHAYN